MLSARALASISDDLVELYAQLEAEIKNKMFKRLKTLQRVTNLDIYQAEIIQQTGGLKNDIENLLSKYDPLIRNQLKSLYTQAMESATKSDIKYYSLAKRELSASQKQILNTSVDRLYNADLINKTYAAQQRRFEELYNSVTRMTLTVADATEKEFLRNCNSAYMKVATGATDWQSAYRDAVNDLAEKGVHTVIYTGSGKPREYTIEAATRMNILTGINQSASQQTIENADLLGADLVEVSAHIGARPAHEDFQGKVYCLNGERDFIDGDGNKRHAFNFYEKCRLGEVDGICGINCRHSFYPYFEGTPLQYSNNELSEYKDKRVTLDGKKITPYEAEQDLRLCERNIRAYKSLANGFEVMGDTENNPKYIAAKEKIYLWQEKARHISNSTGIERKYINEYIGTKQGMQPTGLKPKTIPQKIADIKLENIDYKKLTDNPISNTRELLELKKVAKLDFMGYSEVPSEKTIISRIGGGDLTKGSCSSVSNAFIANLGGYNVTDYRGGLSMDIFSSRRTSIEMAKFNGVESYIEKSLNDFSAVKKLLTNVIEGKYYKLGTGAHAAIVRKKDGILQYLELQTENKNGWYNLNNEVLKKRFKCKKSRTRYGLKIEVENYLIEATSLAKNKEFVELMKYLNTEAEQQIKGIGGGRK